MSRPCQKILTTLLSAVAACNFCVRIPWLRKRASHSMPLSPIPTGKGPFLVGSTDVMSEPSTDGCFLRLFYPIDVEATSSGDLPNWLPGKERRYADGYAHFTWGYLTSVFGFLLNSSVGSIKVPTCWNAPLVSREREDLLPLAIFSHGLGGNRTAYSTVCIELASHGFVVASVEHRDKSASATYFLTKKDGTDNPDGKEGFQQEWIEFYKRPTSQEEFPLRNQQVHHRARECVKALDLLVALNNGEKVANFLEEDFDLGQFKNRLDLDRTCVVGHSFGGATVIASLNKDERFKCGVGLDTWMLPLDKETYLGVNQPLLFINTEKFQWTGNIVRMKRMLPEESQPSDVKSMITIKGTVHMSHADFTFFFNSTLAKFFNLRGPLDPITAIELNNLGMMGFLCKHLDRKYDRQQEAESVLRGDDENVLLGTNVKYETKNSSL